MLKAVAICTPIVAFWAASSMIAWMRTPARRGSLFMRWRNLRSPRPNRSSDSILFDLSRRSAAYFFALRAGSLVRGASYLLLVLCLVTRPGLIFLAPALAVAVWIHNRWQTVANMVFLALTGDSFTAFGEAALTYQFPSQRRGRLWNLGESTVASSLSVVGLGMILIAGLPMLEESDTLTTPIPGLYVQHSHLPYWVLSVVFFAVGALLTVAGTAVDRRVKRRSMRRETALPIRRGAKSPVIFLRPFGTEELLVPAHQGPRRDGIAQILPRREEFLEDIVTWMLWTRGDVLAIAKPGAGAERTVGAAHHVLRDETDWKAAVAELLEGAAQVVLVPGTTPGVSWELEKMGSRKQQSGAKDPACESGAEIERRAIPRRRRRASRTGRAAPRAWPGGARRRPRSRRAAAPL